jgi:hypothetical protein
LSRKSTSRMSPPGKKAAGALVRASRLHQL